MVMMAHQELPYSVEVPSYNEIIFEQLESVHATMVAGVTVKCSYAAA